MNKNNSGLAGVGALVGIVAVFFAARHFVPALASAMLWVAGAGMVLIAALVIVVIYFAFRGSKKTEEQKASGELQAAMNAGKKHLMELRRMSMEVKNSQVRTQSTQVCAAIDQIFRNLKENPENVTSLRQFFDYYLPTIKTILGKYMKLETNGMLTEEVTADVLKSLKEIETAMTATREKMFADDVLDLTVEMEVLRQICKRDGLLDEKGDGEIWQHK